MKVSEAIKILQEILDRRGDMKLEIDYSEFPLALDIDTIETQFIPNAGNFAFIYPRIDDATALLESFVDKGYDEAKNKL